MQTSTRCLIVLATCALVIAALSYMYFTIDMQFFKDCIVDIEVNACPENHVYKWLLVIPALCILCIPILIAAYIVCNLLSTAYSLEEEEPGTGLCFAAFVVLGCIYLA